MNPFTEKDATRESGSKARGQAQEGEKQRNETSDQPAEEREVSAQSSQQQSKTNGDRESQVATEALDDAETRQGEETEATNETQTKVTFTFDGAGILGAYHIGVACYLSEHVDLDCRQLRFAGTSAGAAVAAGLVGGADMREFFAKSKKVMKVVKKNPLRLCPQVRKLLEQTLPDDGEKVLERINGRFHPSLTLWRLPCVCQPLPTGEFHSRKEFIQTVRASAHLPLIGGVRGYKVNSRRFFDGGLSLKFALFPHKKGEKNVVVRVSPWAATKPGWISSDVNFNRAWTVRPRSDETLDRLFRLGYLRAAEFFGAMRRDGVLPLLGDISRPDRVLGEGDLDAVKREIDKETEYFVKKYEMHGKPSEYSDWDNWSTEKYGWLNGDWNMLNARSKYTYNLKRKEHSVRRPDEQDDATWCF